MSEDKTTIDGPDVQEEASRSVISVDELIDHIVRKASDLTGHQIERRENRWRAIVATVFGVITALGFAGLYYFVDQQIRTSAREIQESIEKKIQQQMADQFATVQAAVDRIVDERFQKNFDQATAFTDFLVIANWLDEQRKSYEHGDADEALIHLEELSEDYSLSQNEVFLSTLENLVEIIYNKDDWETLKEIDRLHGENMERSDNVARLMFYYFMEQFLSRMSVDEGTEGRFESYLSHHTTQWSNQIARDYAQLVWHLYHDPSASKDDAAADIDNLLESIGNAPEERREFHESLVKSVYDRHKGRDPQSHENILMTERIEEISNAYDYPPIDYLMGQDEEEASE